MIDVENLRISFRSEQGWEETVRSVSFNVRSGTVLGIVGESGSGKSVTALAIMRLLDPSASRVSGNIHFGSTDLLGLPENEMRSYRGKKIAMIFQEPMTSLNPVFTCGEQVAEAIRIHGKKGEETSAVRQQVIQLFGEVGLPRPESLYDSYPHELSGGQKQRVMIAMALSCDPELLIADEPTTALDASVQKAILELLRTLKDKRKMSMIFISHDLGVIRHLADDVLVMHRGEVVELGPLTKLFAHPEQPYTRGLLASRPQMGVKLERLPVMADFVGSHAAETWQQVRRVITDQEQDDRLEALYRQPPLLEVKSLKTWFPLKGKDPDGNKRYLKAVDDVSFACYPGEVVGLVGESGCGKTTLGRSLLRLEEPTGGEIWYKGTNLMTLSGNALREYRKNIQIIFQDPYSALNPVITIGETLIEPMRVHGRCENDQHRKEEALHLLERVNLKPEHINRYPHEFSGGQRQRIGIARALALRPEFIICDESVSALDVSVQAQVLNLLRDIQQEFELTYLFISHDLAVVYQVADRLLVMNKGKIEESGDPRTIFARPETEYSKKLLDAII